MAQQRTRTARRHRPIQPYWLLGVGAVTLGLSVAMVGGTAVAMADSRVDGAVATHGADSRPATGDATTHRNRVARATCISTSSSSGNRMPRVSTPLPTAAVGPVPSVPKQSARLARVAVPTAAAVPSSNISGLLSALAALFNNQTPRLSPSQSGQNPTGVVSGQLNAVDPDSPRLTYAVTEAPRNGAVAVGADGSWNYTPNSGAAAAGSDSFRVTVSDAASGFAIHGLASLLNMLSFGALGSRGDSSTSTVTVSLGGGSDVATAEREALASVGLRPILDYAATPIVTLGFESAFEAVGWYTTPQTSLTHYELSSDVVHSGATSIKAWVTGANSANIEPDGPNHRGYPTMQLYKRPGGCGTPCLVSLWVWADIPTDHGEWYQIATLSPSATDIWLPSQLVNVGSEGYLHTMHVPTQGLAEHQYQRTDIAFPQQQWVKVDIIIDYRSGGGAIAVFQDGVLISAARIDGTQGANGGGALNQAHFGMYAPPSIASGVIYNDDLVIAELR